MNSKEILNKMTLEEKASLCSGKDVWTTKAIKRLGIPSVMLTDGPHGLRKQIDEGDHLGLNESVIATCFPTASATSCSWDVDLMQEIGEALGEECLQERVGVLLGPGANIKRSPLCGRNFEYISEDPYLSGVMAAAIINGIQSKGVGTSLKHFAMNNQETRRMSIDAVVDKRTQREIYLTGFEIAVKKGKPWTVMCSYNKADGTYLSDNKEFLTKILKEEWGHKGIVVSDWGACNDRIEGIKAGLELEMPSSQGKNDAKIVKAVNNGKLSIEALDKAVIRLIDFGIKAQKNLQKDYLYNVEEHREIAKKAAANSAVLIKNENVLPLEKGKKIAIIGEFAKSPRYQGSGSSIVNPHKLDNVCNVLDAKSIPYSYAQGYKKNSPIADQTLIDEAIKISNSADTVVIFAGLTDEYESEGFDRTHLDLPMSHNSLIEQVSAKRKNVIVVLQNGAPVEMPWINKVSGVLECYLGGEAGASAAVDILFGDVNPSGKLAETFPIKLSDNPSYNYFPGSELTVEYKESIYVGYRYYEKANKDVLFPFGFGLSYTSFEYSNLLINKKNEFEYFVTITVKNTGDVAGSEIVQLYIKNNKSKIFKAEKELRGFDKIFLQPNEEKSINLELNKRSFAYYNTQISDWHVDGGIYGVLIGASSADIRLAADIEIKVNDDIVVPDFKKTLPSYYSLSGEEFKINDSEFASLLGRDIPPSIRDRNEPFTASTTLGEIQHKTIGRILTRKISKVIKNMSPTKDSMPLMYEKIVKEMPLRTIATFGEDEIPPYFVEGIVDMLNGKFFRGLKQMFKR